MKLRVGSDEFVLYYFSPEDDRLGGNALVELPAAEYADYKRVEAEHDAWQKRLHQMWLTSERLA